MELEWVKMDNLQAITLKTNKTGKIDHLLDKELSKF